MAKYSIEDTTLTGIANAIRGKTGKSNPIQVNNMASEIAGITTGISLQEKTVTPSTSSQSVTADNGYDGLSKVTVNAMTTATQATPSINVNSSGLITASATQSAGYVVAGTKSATKQLTTKAATTITPTTSNQTIASGTYLTGVQTIKGDVNLIADNIKSGVSIFGITGTLEAGSGGGASIETCTVVVKDLIGAGTNIFQAIFLVSSGGSLGHYVYSGNTTTETIPNVVCGSIIAMQDYTGYANASLSVDNIVVIDTFALKAPSTSNSTGTIIIQ